MTLEPFALDSRTWFSFILEGTNLSFSNLIAELAVRLRYT